jgi:DNA-binding beta-propeller fold protein YncE
VADSNNTRVLVYNVAPSVIANCENASYVIGATNLTTDNDACCNQSELEFDATMALNVPSGIKYDPATTHLFVSDTDNNRIMIFDGTTISIDPNSFFIPGMTR